MPPYPHYDKYPPPRGAFAAASIPCFPKTDLAPPCLEEALRRGALPMFSIYNIFIVPV